MSTTVTYKGATLTTAENQTRTLLTAGKYLEDNVTITDTAPSYEDGNQMLYGSSSCIVGTATVGSAYAWTDYSGGNVGIAGRAIVGTDATV